MTVVGDIIEFTLKSHSTETNDRFLNVFHYSVDSLSGSSSLAAVGQGIIDDWASNFTSYFQDVISNQTSFDGADLKNITNGLEIFVGDFTDPFAGGVTGDTLPPANTWGFQYVRTNTTTRNGYKRFGLVPESLQQNGIATPAALEDLNALAGQLAAAFIYSQSTPVLFSWTLDPVIVRKNADGEYVLHQDVSDVVYRAIGTQNTRKLGRGM